MIWRRSGLLGLAPLGDERAVVGGSPASKPLDGDLTRRRLLPADPSHGSRFRIFLRNLRINQVVREQIIRMYVRNWDNNIATVYPAGTQCP